jgi:hypothetical protein
MNKVNYDEMTDDLREEYDFSQLSGGIRGKYVKSAQMGSNLVLLEPDIAQVFRTEEAVNQALRLLIQLARTQVTPSPL